MAINLEKNISVLHLLKRLWIYLPRYRKNQFLVILFLMIVSAFAEIISLGAVVPFLGVLVSPEKVMNYPYIKEISSYYGIISAKDLVFPITGLFVATALFGAALRIILLKSSMKLIYSTGTDISVDVFRRTIYQPYLIHLSRNSSEVSSGLNYKVGYTISIMHQTMSFITSAILLITMSLFLFFSSSKIYILTALIFGTCYGFISFFSKKKLGYNSTLISVESTKLIKIIQEGLGGIRDVLLDGTQELYTKIYKESDEKLRNSMGENVVLAGTPRFFMEGIGMVAIAVVAYNVSLTNEGLTNSIPFLGALALGAQRLLPAMQQTYSNWTAIIAAQTSLKETLDFLDQPISSFSASTKVQPLKLNNVIKLNNISFQYSKDDKNVLKNVSFEIKKGQRVGIVGGTGSGKSTLLDIIVGLISPSSGTLEIDGSILNNEKICSWQKSIAHVPQSIFLSDASLSENIALGLSLKDIDIERVISSAKSAKIHDLAKDLPRGYDTEVGERGVRLSGGQRQRIGIARAIYKDASILLLDEATSALDNTTERDVMNSINELNKDLTVLIVAHRLSTIKSCDFIIELRHGEIAGVGNYETLINISESFREMTTSKA